MNNPPKENVYGQRWRQIQQIYHILDFFIHFTDMSHFLVTRYMNNILSLSYSH